MRSPVEVSTSNTTVTSLALCASSQTTPASSTSLRPRLQPGLLWLIGACDSKPRVTPLEIAAMFLPFSGTTSPAIFVTVLLLPNQKPGGRATLRMRYSVSRSLEDSTKDVEWPGPDLRRWRQTTLCKTGIAQATSTAMSESKTAQVSQRSTSPTQQSDAEPITQPLSPSLRSNPSRPNRATASLPAVSLPAVSPGQTRITNLPRVSTR